MLQMFRVKIRKYHFVIFFAVVCVFIVIALHCCKHLPFSPLFKLFNSKHELLDKAHAFNKIRLRKAVDYFTASKNVSVDDVLAKTRGTLDFVVVVVTVARTQYGDSIPRGYLLQTAATMDVLMRTQASNSLLLICNANESPGFHRDAVYLQRYLPYVNRLTSNVIVWDFSHKPKLRNTKLTDPNMIKAIEDYIFCLNATQYLNSKYVIVLEDDVIPLKESFNVIKHTLERLKRGVIGGCHKIRNNFAFIQLFYPQKWQGFAFDFERIPELLCYGIVGGVTLTVCYLATVDYSASLRLQFVLWTAVCMALADLVGRVHLLELRRASPWLYTFGSNRGCCTPAMLYPAPVVPRLMEHLLHNASLVKDLAILDFPARTGNHGYQLEPNLFLHTGMYTSRPKSGTSYKDPRDYLFDMPFELDVT